MLDPASPQLVALLNDLRICTPAELRHCARYVRKLVSDLPAFDSVWIDALVQTRKLTPFQAGLLSSDQPQQIRLGSSILVDRLGEGQDAETFLARSQSERELYVVKRLFGESSQTPDFQLRLRDLVVGSQGISHPALATPTRVESSSRGLLIHSRYIPGFHLGELLIRRGRYPASVVWEIAHQLIEGLAVLHRRGLVHGELRLENIRLTDAGQCVIVDTGIRNALDPELIPHSNLPPDCYDTTPPELIGTGRPGDTASDLYSLGCVLWQLLAGRPPYPTGDPLAKLVAHQTKRIDDVRDWAPETPAQLADLIRDLTHPDPALRPRSAGDLLGRFPQSSTNGKRRLARFLARFRTPSAGGAIEDQEVQVSLQTWGMLILFIAIGLGVILSDHDSRLNLAEFVGDLFRRSPAKKQEIRLADASSASVTITSEAVLPPHNETQTEIPTTTAQDYLELPNPDQEGIVTLTEAGPYLAREYHGIVGPLTIRSASPNRSRILVQDGQHPLSVTATDLRLEGVSLEFDPTMKGEENGILLKTRAQSVTLIHSRCLLESSGNSSTSATHRRTAIAWKGIESKPGGNRLLVQDSEILGNGIAIHIDGNVQRVELSNVLKTGSGAICNIATDTQTTFQTLILNQTTCRDISSLVRCQGGWLNQISSRRKKLMIELTDCIVSLTPEQGALIEMIAPELPDRWNQLLEIVGENSVSAKGLQIVHWRRNPAESAEVPPGINDFLLEGLLTADLQFAGTSLLNPEDSMVPKRTRIPLTSADSLPGYHPVVFEPAERGGRLNAN